MGLSAATRVPLVNDNAHSRELTQPQFCMLKLQTIVSHKQVQEIMQFTVICEGPLPRDGHSNPINRFRVDTMAFLGSVAASQRLDSYVEDLKDPKDKKCLRSRVAASSQKST